MSGRRASGGFQADARVRDDAALWQRLMETPYDDVRIELVPDL